jgi:hypothetical protein
MVNSPISIPLALSQSRKPSDLLKIQAIAADAFKIERYINTRMETDFIREFDFSALAADLSMDQERVRSLLSKLADHENAITVCNPQKRPRTPVTGMATSHASSRTSAGVRIWNEPSLTASEATI